MELSPFHMQSDEVRRVLDQAVTLPPGERLAYLVDLCRGRPAVKREISLLLQDEDGASDVLDGIGAEATNILRKTIQDLDSAPVAGDNELIGSVVSHYEIVAKLGGGGMGVVYKARDTKLGRLVALKFLPQSLNRDDAARRRFIREAQAASGFDHPNICTIYDIDEDPDGVLFIAMAYVRGETLKAKIERGRIPLDDALEYGRQIACALERAHETGIVHRDVKPANVIVDEGGTAKLLDFGLVKLADASGVTREGAIVGTASYMSPEQIRGDEVDHRTDVWSLGVLLYEMIAGKRPFDADYEQALLYFIVNVEPEHLRASCDDEDLAVAVMRALEKNPADRFADMRAFRQALDRSQRPTKNHRRKSIAVLPFEDLSPSKDDQHFSDGVSEELILGLSQIGSLRVICRTSAWQAKEAGKSIQALRRELDVDYVLEGSVRKAGNRIRVTPRLIETETEATVWSAKHDGELENIFDIQDRVAYATVEALKLKLSNLESDRLTRRPFEDAQAYECYLRARQEILKYTPESLELALNHLNNGIEIVGENAVLYAGIGYVHWTYANLGMDRKANLAEARAYAQRAFDLAPDQALGVRVVGLIAALEGHQKEAINRLERAHQLDPNDLETMQWLRIMYGYVGKMDRAAPLAEEEVSIDPLNPVSQSAKGWLQFMRGEFDLALDAYGRMYHMDPHNPAYIYFYAQALGYTGRRTEACELIDELLEAMPDHPYAWMCRCFKHALQGDRSQLERSVTPQLEALAQDDLSHAWFMADCYAIVEADEAAISWLETAVDLGFVNYPFLSNADPFLRRLRGKQAFERLMDRVKQEWQNF